MRRAANFFKLDSWESDTDEERKKSSKVRVEKAVVNTDDAKRETGKRKRVDDIDLGAEENTRDEPNKKKKPTSVDSEVEESSLSSKKRKKKKPSEDPEAEGNANNGGAKDANQTQSENPEAEGNELKSTKDPKKKRNKKQSEDSEAEGNDLNSTENAEKRQSEVSEAEGNDLNSKKDPKKKWKKSKKKQSEDPEAQGDDLNFTENAEKKQSENSEAEGNGLNSTESAKKKKKKTKKQSEDPEVEENNNDGAKDAEKNQSEDSEAEGNGLNSTEIAKKKRKMKKKQSEDPEAEENNGKKKKKKQSKSDEVVTTPSSKSAKKVKFSDQVEVFPTEDEESEEDDEEEEEVGVVRGKRFTKEEDELIKKSVLAYVENHALGDEGVKMVLDCKSHKQVRGCWKEIATVLPWRPYTSVYHRAHTIFEQGSKGVWSKEDFDLVIKYHKKYGNDWRTLADAMGKSRKHVKDAWRRIRLASKKNGHWSMGEYQSLFDLVNKDLRMKAFQEKRAKHGMLRDNIPWMAISDQIRTRDHVICCQKWYDQLTSPMVKKGIWANVDDYRLLDKLTSLDAACVDDVDWDDLLDNRDGDACRSRWNQMVHHIGIPGTKTFAEQVEILSQRYCPDIAEDREDFDNRPFDPEDED